MLSSDHFGKATTTEHFKIKAKQFTDLEYQEVGMMARYILRGAEVYPGKGNLTGTVETFRVYWRFNLTVILVGSIRFIDLFSSTDCGPLRRRTTQEPSAPTREERNSHEDTERDQKWR